MKNKLYSLCFLLLLAKIVFCQHSNGNAINPLYVDPATRDFSNNPELLERIKGSPHGYFRFINIEFSKEICRRFQNRLPGTPSFNLHGDAHIEQYAITDLGRGLTDFDDSSTGPAIIDLMRFGVSVHLACRQKGWPEQALKIYDKFISGYRMALNYPDSAATEPGLVQRIKQKFKFNREAYFKWVDSVIQPMPEEGKTQLINAMQPYIATMLVVKKDLDTSFFKIKDVGFLKLGIGSAQDIKYLVRVEGLTDETLDDVVLEVKQVRDLSGIDCITIAQKDDPFRVLVGQARIAYEPYKLLGHIRMKGISFWVHSWVDNYKEIEIAESFQSPEDMAEIAYDVGVQLGKGHVNQIAAPLDIQLRREQISLLNQYEPEIKEACIDLGLLTTKAWETFCLKVKRNNTRL